jgi:hypothetical protein
MDNREQQLAKHINDDHRLQYDGEDEARLDNLATTFTQAAVAMIEALGEFREAAKAEVDESSADRMKSARYDAVYAWTMVQAAVSKVALVLRIDGDEAFSRAITAAWEEGPDGIPGAPDFGDL